MAIVAGAPPVPDVRVAPNVTGDPLVRRRSPLPGPTRPVPAVRMGWAKPDNRRVNQRENTGTGGTRDHGENHRLAQWEGQSGGIEGLHHERRPGHLTNRHALPVSRHKHQLRWCRRKGELALSGKTGRTHRDDVDRVGEKRRCDYPGTVQPDGMEIVELRRVTGGKPDRHAGNDCPALPRTWALAKMLSPPATIGCVNVIDTLSARAPGPT